MASVSRNLESAVRFTLKELAEIEGVDVTVHVEDLRRH